MHSPVSLFVNPTAGRGRTRRRVARILEILGASGIEVQTYESRNVGDLERQVCERVGTGDTRIVVAGGDGSIHEAVNGIMSAGSGAALGVIPSGTGNDFAKAGAIPLHWEQATQLLADRLAGDVISLSVDLGRMNDRYFANGAGIGFDAEVTRVARSYRLPIGDLVYLLAIMRSMSRGIASPEVEISGDAAELDGIVDGARARRPASWRGPVTLVNVSNGPWIGGMFHIAPMADHSDGRLELLIAAPVTRRRILRLLPKLMRGAHMNEAEITHASVRRVRIEASVPVPSHLDGEVQAPAQVFDIEVLPGALRLL